MGKSDAWPGLEKGTAEPLLGEDPGILSTDLDRVVSPWKEPFVAEMIAKNKANVQKLVEIVNHNSKQVA